MVRILIDTHTFLWALLEPDRLSGTARDILRDPATSVIVSAATAWEIATKHRLGKLPGAAAVVTDYTAHLRTFRAEELQVSSIHALLAGAFPQPHRDPFDRMLAAQSSIEGLPFLTNDPAFRDFPVTLVW